ncbi:MAG: radical SAM protein, partial [Kaistella sp.]
EMVRQMFEMGVLQSGFWHQFAMTAHSPVGLNPEEFGVTPLTKEIGFANNDIEFKDETNIDHSKFGYGLKKSLFNYMHGINFEMPLQDWFDFKIPPTTVHPDYIHDCLLEDETFKFKGTSNIIFLSKNPIAEDFVKSKKGKSYEMTQLTFHLNTNIVKIELDQKKAGWLLAIM